jgi:hypothetical protein
MPLIDFRRYRVRIIVALAIALALHEIFLSLLRVPAPAKTHEDPVAAPIAIVIRRSPTPKPSAQPTPPPRLTPPPHVTLAPIAQIAGRVHGTPAKHRAGGARHAAAKAVAQQHAAPHAAGSGPGSAVGVGAGDVAGVGGGLAGAGNGETGNGNGAVNANAPCGVVEFIPHATPRFVGTTAYETIFATVTFPDGHKETEKFPYPWIYPDAERTDPWSNTNLCKPNFEATLQLPPADVDRSGFPPLIAYILSHTNAGGYTDLPECPKAPR